MSYAIKALGLESLPVTVTTIGSRHALLWIATCQCGDATKPYRLLSAAMEQMSWHGDMHRAWTFEGHAA